MIGLRKNLAEIVIVGACFLFSGCFLTEILPGGDEKRRSGPQPVEEPPVEKPPKSIPAGNISDIRLIRRASLDLTGNLPMTADYDEVEKSPELVLRYINVYAESAEAHVYLAKQHKFMWNMKPSHLRDLDDFINLGLGLTSAQLTDSVRNTIVDEPIMLLRYGFEQNMPFSEIFNLNYGIVHKDRISLWDHTSAGTPWPGEPWRFVDYKDGRPVGGPAVSNGFLAHFSGGASADQRSRVAKILADFMCTELESSLAHKFTSVSEENLLLNLSDVGAQTSPCVGCHDHFTQGGKAFDGLASGLNFTEWTSSTASSNPIDHYAGHAVASQSEFMANLGKDPRTHRCEVQRLLEVILQRPLKGYDDPTLAIALRTFYDSDQDLSSTLITLINNREYKFAAADGKVTLGHLRDSTGVKFLNSTQWETILAGLGTRAAALLVPEEIRAGVDETIFSKDAIPNGSYWHYTIRLARQVATAIVADELADDSIPETRVLLKMLPPGAAAGINVDTAMAQLSDIWKYLTGSPLDASSQKYVDLKALWTSSLGNGTSSNSYRQAWRTLLTAAFSDFSFIMY
jgi:hypothetical protein